VCQLCAKTHSMFRVPDLFWLTGAVFRNISVTHSKFSKRKKSSKTWDFGPARRNGNFSDTPGDFQKVILCFSPALYISVCFMYVFLGVTRYLKAQFQLSQVPQPKNNNNRFFQD
jgi:hypothetical protein